MRFVIIGDKETITGFSLIGVDGYEANSKQESIHALKDALVRKDVGIILITERIARPIQSMIDDLLCQKKCALILQIPDFSCTLENRRSVEEIVLSALGVRV